MTSVAVALGKCRGNSGEFPQCCRVVITFRLCVLSLVKCNSKKITEIGPYFQICHKQDRHFIMHCSRLSAECAMRVAAITSTGSMKWRHLANDIL